MRRIVDAFVEYERLVIRARTRAALTVKRSRGERIGGIPYGHQLAARRLAHAREAVTVSHANCRIRMG